VIVAGLQKVKEGAPAKPVPWQPHAPANGAPASAPGTAPAGKSAAPEAAAPATDKATDAEQAE